MVVTDQSDILSQGEVESPLQSADQQQPKNHNAFPSLGRHESSIYSLTLDEFQHTLSDGGKNFGSMNMDELLNSIWTAEENQTHAHAQVKNSSIVIPTAATTATATTNINALFPQGEISTSTEKGIAKQPSLPRQGSLTLPAPLCRKTVEEVWSEMHSTRQEQQHSSTSNVQNTGSSQRQPIFGEMTLEDFLVKAGVVREQGHPPPPSPLLQPLLQQPYGLYQNNNNTAVGPSYMARPIMAIGGGGGRVGVLAYPAVPQSAVGDAAAGFVSGGKRSAGGYQPPAICYGGRIPNGGSGGGYGQVQGLGLGSPVSPVSSDGMGTSQGDSVNRYGLDMDGMRGGRKRIIDGPVEKVVERRQRRMIKNRESAARSRARKQAYTVELEAELNQLKEENAHLKQALAELERKLN